MSYNIVNSINRIATLDNWKSNSLQLVQQIQSSAATRLFFMFGWVQLPNTSVQAQYEFNMG